MIGFRISGAELIWHGNYFSRFLFIIRGSFRFQRYGVGGRHVSCISSLSEELNFCNRTYRMSGTLRFDDDGDDVNGKVGEGRAACGVRPGMTLPLPMDGARPCGVFWGADAEAECTNPFFFHKDVAMWVRRPATAGIARLVFDPSVLYYAYDRRVIGHITTLTSTKGDHK